MSALFLCLLCYLIGCFPTGYLVGKLNGVTIWEHGSGNVGATNISRVLGKKAGIITLGGDLLKGFLPLALFSVFGFLPHNLGCLGLFIILGHCFSIPGYLRGGKGVATALGVFFGLSPIIALLSLATFVIMMVITRIVSLSSIIAAIFVPIYAMLLYPEYHQPFVPWLMAISAVVIARHHENIRRLIEGKEKRFEFSKKQPAE